METYIGIDLGGTKLLIGEIDSHGNILRYKKYESAFFNQHDAVNIIKASLDDYIGTVGWYEKKPLAMGVGLIGRVDTKNGIWLQIDPGRTHPINLAEELSGAYGMPCHIDNDVKSATRAERVWGFGLITRNFVYINIGTGIAAGMVVNGRQIRGSHCNAGEVGHIRVGVGVGVRCSCGKIDCVEAIASGIGFDQCARLLADRYETQLEIPDSDERVPTAEIFALSKKGDPLCVKLVENAAEAISNLIMNMVRMCDPDAVVLGGGVVADGYLHSKVLERLHPTTMRFVQNEVVITKLNPDFIGLLGAGAVAMGK
ncbi:MAG: ROK family protein [Mediterranea sp.]|jgi:predicted NBD/HSP70 family sugar kinase|nr:ROK family protein [Mediterranea sp.]